ncbi:hypothetical protein [Chelativorans sp. M5D2P16]|uniref:hypothetical protein n=1 Tax=Chelativorans sp. M5D2P16 TaxID=3095678 RepID=UPI002ACAB05D|nr:hypothetical protein [Chelativorans sp. M5D2P16]MDZ5697242.1 hypothetical protein [Chelativorans sp. M5D2P16]
MGIALALCAVLFVIGWLTRKDPSEAPYLTITGGGFVFNYRDAEVFYGFSAQVTRPLASGSIIEAHFEDPAGGAPFIVMERVSTMTDRYSLRSPALGKVEAGKPYKVAIRVLDREGETLLWRTERSYQSRIGDSALPDAPLTVGPGYHRPEGLAGKGAAGN